MIFRKKLAAGNGKGIGNDWRALSFASVLIVLQASFCPAGAGETATRSAAQLIEQGDYQGAVTLLQKNTSDPKFMRSDYSAGISLSLLGLAYLKLGEHLKAVDSEAAALARFKRVNDKSWQRTCLVESAEAYAALKRFHDAADKYRAAVLLDEEGENENEKRQDLQNLAWMQEKTGNLKGALATWEKLLRDAGPRDKYLSGDCRLNMAALQEKLGAKSTAAELRAEGQKLVDEAAHASKKMNADGSVDQIYFAAVQKMQAEDPQGACRLYEEMLAAARKRGFRNGMVTALLSLSVCDSGSGRYDSAREGLEEALRLTREDGDETNEGVALGTLGVVYANLGDLNKSLSMLEQARILNAKIGEVYNEIEVLHSIRFVYSILGDFPRMLAVNSQMSETAKRSGRKRALLKAEYDIGRFYGEIGDHQAAIEHYKTALELARQVGDGAVMANMLNGYGIASMNIGEYAAAENALRESLERKDWPGGRVNLAEIFLYKNEMERAAELLRPINPQHVNMGYYYLAKGELQQARSAYKDALSGTRSVDTLFASRTGLGLAYEGLKDYFKASYHFREAEKVLERQRDSLSLAHRLYFMGVVDWMWPHLEPYEGLVRIAEFMPGGLRDSLYRAEFTRARIFTESAARNYGAPDTRIPPALSAAEQRFNQAISSTALRVEAANRSTDRTAFARLDSELTDLKKKRDLFAEGLRRDYPEYAAVRYPQPLYAEEFALRPGEVLIEFEVTRPYTKVFVVKDGRVAFSYDVRLTRGELSTMVRKYRSFFEEVSGSRQLAAFDPRLGNRLYRLLLEPAFRAKENGVPLIPAAAALIVATDEILSVLPFESLVVSMPARVRLVPGRFGPVPVGVKYMGDTYDIAYSHSGTALTIQRRLKSKTSPLSDLLVLADPIFNPADSRLRGPAPVRTEADIGTRKIADAIGATMGLGGGRPGAAREKEISRENFVFPRLDKTGLLARALKGKVFRGRSSEVLVGSAASKEGFLKADISNYRYLVIATHGILDNMVPGLREPALVLNQIGNAPGDNGLLTMSEIMTLRLNADVAALTACQTGLGAHLTGEGVMGLGRAFQYAGARKVLVSLWSVSEDSTTMLVESFFTYLRKGHSARRALRLARAHVRRAGYEHPFFWAPFILISD